MGAATQTETASRAEPETSSGAAHDWRHWTDEPWVLFVVLGAAFIVLTGTIQVVHPLDRDEGAFLVIAQSILHGRVPYRDVFDHKSPAIYYLLAALLALTSRLSLMSQIVALRLVVALANLISAAGLVALGKRWKSLEVGALAAALWLLALPLYWGVYAFTEPFAVAATLWALVLASRRPTWRAAAGTGLLLALAALFKQTAVLAIPAAALLLFCGPLPEGRWRPPARPLLTAAGALLAGLILPWLLVTGAFFVVGAGGPFIQDVLIANLHYPPDPPLALIEGIITGVDAFPLLWFTATLVTCLGGWAWLRRRSPDHRARLNPGLAAAGLAGLLNLIPFISHAYPHYWLQVLPWTALLSAYAILSVIERWRPARSLHSDRDNLTAADRILQRLMLPVLLGVVIATTSSSSLFVTAHLDTASSDLRTQIVAGEWIRAHVPPSARLLVAPAEPELYYVSGHQPATTYIYLLPVNLTPALIAQVTDDLQRGTFDAVVWQLNIGPSQPAVAPELSGIYAALSARYRLVAIYPSLALQLFEPPATGYQRPSLQA